MKALVTGSAGFVGRHMVADLERRGCDINTWDIAEGNDCLDLFGWDTVRYDLVVHAAAKAPHRAAIDGQPAAMVYNQALDGAMFEWAVRTRQRRVLYLSSCAALDGPDDYGWIKLTGERMAAQARGAGVPVTVVRPFSGYGEDQGIDWPFGAFAARARHRADPFVIWGDGSQVRDWIHIDDVVAGALAVVESGVDEPVSLCTGRGVSMNELAGMFTGAAGYRPRFELHREQPAGVAYRVGDPSHMRQYYRPKVELEDGILRALNHVESNR